MNFRTVLSDGMSVDVEYNIDGNDIINIRVQDTDSEQEIDFDLLSYEDQDYLDQECLVDSQMEYGFND